MRGVIFILRGKQKITLFSCNIKAETVVYRKRLGWRVLVVNETSVYVLIFGVRLDSLIGLKNCVTKDLTLCILKTI